MTVRSINRENIKGYRGLFLPEVAERIMDGETITALVVFDEDQPAGAVAGKYTEDGFMIMSLFVVPELRRRGAADALMDTIDDILLGFDVPVVCDFMAITESARMIIPFLEHRGYYPVERAGHELCVTTLEKIGKSEIIQKRGKGKYYPIDFVDDDVLKAIEKDAQKHNAPMPEGGIFSDSVDRELSFVLLREKEVAEWILVEKWEEDVYYISSVWAKNGLSGALRGLFGACYTAASAKLSPSTTVLTRTTSDITLEMAAALLGGAEPASFTYRLDAPPSWEFSAFDVEDEYDDVKVSTDKMSEKFWITLDMLAPISEINLDNN